MQPPPSEEDATLAFEDGFAQMAERLFSTKFPELMERVVTFKILKSEIDTGSGVGAFILDVDGETVYVPVVLAANAIKPLEIMYFKEKDIFLPLTPEWLDEVARGALDSLGKGTKPPETLNPDQDIRDVVVPPSAGRFAYAAEATSGVKLAQFLASAPNRVKVAFKTVLERNHDILKFAFEHFDKEMLLESLRPHPEPKTASAKGSVVILTPESPAAAFRVVFGEKTAAAYQLAVKHGYVIADTRPVTQRALVTQDPLRLVTTQENGFYWLYMKDGGRERALVIANPQLLRSDMDAAPRVDQRKHPDPYKRERKIPKEQVLVGKEWPADLPGDSDQQFLVVMESGKILVTDKTPLGEWIPPEDISGRLIDMLRGSTDGQLGQGTGTFLAFRGGKFMGTMPCVVQSVSTGSDGVRRVKTFGGDVIVTDPKAPIKQIVAPKGSNVTYMPAHYKFFTGERVYDSPLLESASDTLSHISRLEKVGAVKAKIIDAGSGTFSISGLSMVPQSKVAMVQTMMVGMELPASDVHEILEKTAAEGKASFYIVNRDQLRNFARLTKIAQGEAPPPPAGPPGGSGGMPQEGMPPEGMPAEGAMPPPEMMPPPPPPPPNPVELAVDDIGAQVVEQSAQVAEALAAEQRELSNKMNILQSVKERAAQTAAEMSGAPPEMTGPPAGPEQVPPPMAPPPPYTFSEKLSKTALFRRTGLPPSK